MWPGRSDSGPSVFFHSKRSRDLIAFEIVAAGEPQELRPHVDEHLQQVGAEAVGLVPEGRRKQRDQAEPDRSGTIDGQDEARLCGRRERWRSSASLRYCFHVCVRPEHPSGGVRRLAVFALDRDGDRSGEARRRLREERRAIAGVRPDRNAPVALVGDAGRRVRLDACVTSRRRLVAIVALSG